MTASSPDWIVIQGAREHNLKDVTVRFPRNQLSVVSGVSGSGKSTLLFNILVQEGERKFVSASPDMPRTMYSVRIMTTSMACHQSSALVNIITTSADAPLSERIVKFIHTFAFYTPLLVNELARTAIRYSTMQIYEHPLFACPKRITCIKNNMLALPADNQ